MIFIFSLLLFVLYKFYWKTLVAGLLRARNQSSGLIDAPDNLFEELKDTHFSLFSLLLWMSYAQKLAASQSFLL